MIPCCNCKTLCPFSDFDVGFYLISRTGKLGRCSACQKLFRNSHAKPVYPQPQLDGDTIPCYLCKGMFSSDKFDLEKYAKAGFLGSCKDCRTARKLRTKTTTKEWWQNNREYYNAYTKQAHRDYRQKVLDHYGGSCACCGESTYEFLALDHIYGGGGEHIHKVKSPLHWIVRNGYPEGFRVLCHNCNNSIAKRNYCPHNNGIFTEDPSNKPPNSY